MNRLGMSLLCVGLILEGCVWSDSVRSADALQELCEVLQPHLRDWAALTMSDTVALGVPAQLPSDPADRLSKAALRVDRVLYGGAADEVVTVRFWPWPNAWEQKGRSSITQDDLKSAAGRDCVVFLEGGRLARTAGDGLLGLMPLEGAEIEEELAAFVELMSWDPVVMARLAGRRSSDINEQVAAVRSSLGSSERLQLALEGLAASGAERLPELLAIMVDIHTGAATNDASGVAYVVVHGVHRNPIDLWDALHCVAEVWGVHEHLRPDRSGRRRLLRQLALRSLAVRRV